MSNLFSRFFGMCWTAPSKSNAGLVTTMHKVATGNAKIRRIANAPIRYSTGPVRSRAFRNG